MGVRMAERATRDNKAALRGGQCVEQRLLSVQ